MPKTHPDAQRWAFLLNQGGVAFQRLAELTEPVADVPIGGVILAPQAKLLRCWHRARRGGLRGRFAHCRPEGGAKIDSPEGLSLRNYQQIT
jgi:hypothetical protein